MQPRFQQADSELAQQRFCGRRLIAGLVLALAVPALSSAEPTVAPSDSSYRSANAYTIARTDTRLFGLSLNEGILPGFARERPVRRGASAQQRFAVVARKYAVGAVGAQSNRPSKPVDHRDNVLRLRF